jgi:hypothetical protein
MELAFEALHQLCAPMLGHTNRLPGPQSIALARYPHQFHWASASGPVYLAVLTSMLVAGAAGLARLGRR